MAIRMSEDRTVSDHMFLVRLLVRQVGQGHRGIPSTQLRVLVVQHIYQRSDAVQLDDLQFVGLVHADVTQRHRREASHFRRSGSTRLDQQLQTTGVDDLGLVRGMRGQATQRSGTELLARVVRLGKAMSGPKRLIGQS